MSLFADSSQTSLAYGVQIDSTTQQTTLTSLRNTGSTLQFNATSEQSNEIRADRNVTDIIRTQSSVSGDVNFELSYATYDDFVAAVLSTGDTAPGILTNGTTKKYFTFERKFETGATDIYEQFMSNEIDTMSLNFAASSIVTGSMTMLGINATQSATSIDGDGYTPANTNRVFNAVNMVTTVLEGGVEYKSNVQSLTMEFANNKRESRAIGSEAPSCIGDGQFTVTGTLTTYLKDNVVYDKFLGQTISSIELGLEDDAGNIINIDLPSVIYSETDRSVGGNNEDVLAVYNFQAVYDAGIGGTTQWTITDTI